MKISDKSLAFRHLGFPKKKKIKIKNLFNQLTEMTFFHVLDFWDPALKTK